MRTLADLVRDHEPVVFPPGANVKEAARRMRERGVGAVLVADDARLIGIFTGRDAIGRILAEGRDPAATTLAEVMTENPETMTPRHTAIEALRMMRDARCRHLPIVEEGRIVGIVSRGDFRGTEQDRLDEETGLWERIAY
ncbi:MAG TPA: CBS domain-containing protein [Stellaceae bacterium]|nr:CBS domain-containing protein [Stellaceae bacterium]